MFSLYSCSISRGTAVITSGVNLPNTELTNLYPIASPHTYLSVLWPVKGIFLELFCMYLVQISQIQIVQESKSGNKNKGNIGNYPLYRVILQVLISSSIFIYFSEFPHPRFALCIMSKVIVVTNGRDRERYIYPILTETYATIYPVLPITNWQHKFPV